MLLKTSQHIFKWLVYNGDTFLIIIILSSSVFLHTWPSSLPFGQDSLLLGTGATSGVRLRYY